MTSIVDLLANGSLVKVVAGRRRACDGLILSSHVVLNRPPCARTCLRPASRCGDVQPGGGVHPLTAGVSRTPRRTVLEGTGVAAAACAAVVNVTVGVAAPRAAAFAAGLRAAAGALGAVDGTHASG